ncbi:MAG: hypothetical protein PHO41_07095 [Eubacteriales bacterium]|nr:hypothetical protein [Eubacteriales bacterium]
MEERIAAMLQTLTEIDTKLDNALTKLNDHEARLRELEGKNGRRWETLLTQVTLMLVAAVIGAFTGSKL